ncbi:MAG: 23S rRNA (pseudouridine(1915)-N(3))-methyltransferase RlmH [Thermodesulfobacteriota bacterium]
MRFEFLFFGKPKAAYLATGIDDFAGRLRHYAEISIKILKEQKGNDREAERVLAKEGEELLRHIAKGSHVVALDVGGREYSSEQLAETITRWEGQGITQVAFLIGGPLGLAPAVRERADLLLSLSRLTFTHDLARLLLLEQLYRAYTIKAGTGYHK